jgi:hypothetical protein
MLNGNETITDRLLILSYELLEILSKWKELLNEKVTD